MRNVPWAGLVALLAMFLLPARLFEPRTIKHRPLRHVCADCGARWAPGHTCDPGPTAPGTADRPAPEPLDPDRPVKSSSSGSTGRGSSSPGWPAGSAGGADPRRPGGPGPRPA